MKKYFIILTALLMSTIFTCSTFSGSINDDPEEIQIERQQNGDEPTSTGTCLVQAFKTSTLLMTNFYNYTGNSSVIVIGQYGNIISASSMIVGSGTIVLNISTLPDGDYSIFINSDAVYIGTFRK